MKKVIIVCIISVLFVGCGGSSAVDKAMSQVEKSTEKLEKGKGKMTEADWNALNKEMEEPFNVLADAVKNNKVGAMSKIKIVALTARWTAAAAAAGFDEMGKQLGVDGEKVGKALEDASKELDKAAADTSGESAPTTP